MCQIVMPVNVILCFVDQSALRSSRSIRITHVLIIIVVVVITSIFHPRTGHYPSDIIRLISVAPEVRSVWLAMTFGHAALQPLTYSSRKRSVSVLCVSVVFVCFSPERFQLVLEYSSVIHVHAGSAKSFVGTDSNNFQR